MKTLEEMQMDEAINRLELLTAAGKLPDALFYFQQGLVKFYGGDEWIPLLEPGAEQMVMTELEQKFGIKIYFGFRSDDGPVTSTVFCYVSPYPDEWANERDLLSHGSFPAVYFSWTHPNVTFALFPPADAE